MVFYHSTFFLILLSFTVLTPVHAFDNLPVPREKECLNGWWDFRPDLSERGKTHHPPGEIPSEGWLTDKILVPGSWTDGNNGADYTAEELEQKTWLTWRIFDSYGYPVEWARTSTAWYRTTFTVPKIQKNRRYFIRFDGILREAWIFINEKEAGHSTNGIMPCELDITPLLEKGDNRLHVYVTDYRRDENGRTFTPTGADQVMRQKGIWQDVFLISRPDVYIDDVTIRTSVRRNRLTLLVAVKNSSKTKRTVTPDFTVTENDLQHLSFSGAPATLAAGETGSVTIEHTWDTYIPWSPNQPQLYDLNCRLLEKNKSLDWVTERFGFREVWIEKHHLMLNGTPVHLFGDWGHKNSFDNFRPEYIRQWFRMMKDCNMNYMRTHTFPHPEIVLDIADEMGVLICLESAWFFTHGQAIDKEEAWKGGEQHVRDIIRRDKNHPSIILWSVGNEVRWGWNRNAVIENMPRLRKLYEKLDPTRIPYHDGDSSLWDERTQHLISRHYGYECTGEDWWDRSKPLHVGEVGKWHFAQPIDNAIWGDDRIFSSYEQCKRVIALECADLAEQARANEVCCFFPWNLSCLDNYRPWPKERGFEWDDVNTPGIKPLRSGAYGSEFAWWHPESKGYAPGPGFEIMKHAFRPCAVIVREKLNRFFDNDRIKHSVTVVNDTGGELKGTLRVRLCYGDTVRWEQRLSIIVDQGYSWKQQMYIPVAGVETETPAVVETKLFDKARSRDRHRRPVVISPAGLKKEPWPLKSLALLGGEDIEDVLKDHGVTLVQVDSLVEVDANKTPLLLVGKGAIVAGSRQNRELEKFTAGGGRVVLLEQTASPFPQVPISSKPAEKVHIRGGNRDLLAGFTASDFEYWGNDPFGRTHSDSWVVVQPYQKPKGGNTRIFLHSGYGFFGNGGLEWTPLFETRVGDGLALACQLRLSDKVGTHPAALKLLRRMLVYAENWRPEKQTVPAVSGAVNAAFLAGLGVETASGDSATVLLADAGTSDLGRVKKQLQAGSICVLTQLDSTAVRKISQTLDIPLQAVDLGVQYNLVRRREDTLLDGISNQELYWLDLGQYSSSDNKNRPITRTLLKCPGAQLLLSSEHQSCWRELHTLGARSERYRMPVITHYLWDGPRASAGGLLKLDILNGCLVLCQVPMPEDDYKRAGIFWSHLLNNLGVKMAKNLFQGEKTLPGEQRSPGYPAQISCLADPSPERVKQVLTAAKPAEYRLSNQALANGFLWQTVQGENGVYDLPDDAKKIVIAFQVDPGRPRVKTMRDGLPDPGRQTLLDLAGKGTAVVYINGEKFESVDFGREGKITVADIDLNRYWNSVVIILYPKHHKLGILWRNRQNQPEVEFGFQ